MPTLFLDQIPLWAFLCLSVLISFLSIECGFLLCKYHHLKNGQGNEVSLGSMVGPALGLLAFMLAFTFGMAAAHFDDRRVLVVQEANAIEAAYLRSDLVEDPYKSRVKELLRQYVVARLDSMVHPKLMSQTISKSESLLNQLWSQAVEVGQKHPNSEICALFISSINEVIDMHSKRVTAHVRTRVPESIWATLFLVAILSMAGTGYQCGFAGKRSLPGSVILVITFSMVMFLIADLDRPWEGFLQANQQCLIDLSIRMGQPAH